MTESNDIIFSRINSKYHHNIQGFFFNKYIIYASHTASTDRYTVIHHYIDALILKLQYRYAYCDTSMHHNIIPSLQNINTTTIVFILHVHVEWYADSQR